MTDEFEFEFDKISDEFLEKLENKFEEPFQRVIKKNVHFSKHAIDKLKERSGLDVITWKQRDVIQRAVSNFSAMNEVSDGKTSPESTVKVRINNRTINAVFKKYNYSIIIKTFKLWDDVGYVPSAPTDINKIIIKKKKAIAERQW